ncbi:MAG: outer membrane protein assembly factor BamD [Bacteroidetes bacterium]|nr:outer membrane protein assembly factor BamD [Bacteroidota bacterium]MBL6942937.1 outer membrane protein assembly factor BamD [Bacteroidales bacterium]
MSRKIVFFILVAGIVVVGFACNNYSKIIKSGNNELKYETGVDLYDKGDYSKALQFFDILRAVHRGTEKGEKLTYYSANCYFQMKDYQIASYYYNQYVQMYPRGEHAEESAFLSAYCNYLESPRASLDQTSTYIALRELQSFIDMYPKSAKVEEVHRLMDELRGKLEVKNYNIGMLFYKMGDYQAAITSFENLLDDYPDTDFKEEVLYSITKAYFTYAEKSIKSRKDERYEKTIESYNNLLYLFPESGYLKEVEDINKEAHKNLKNK